jgi:hypothetical protein
VKTLELLTPSIVLTSTVSLPMWILDCTGLRNQLTVLTNWSVWQSVWIGSSIITVCVICKVHTPTYAVISHQSCDSLLPSVKRGFRFIPASLLVSHSYHSPPPPATFHSPAPSSKIRDGSYKTQFSQILFTWAACIHNYSNLDWRYYSTWVKTWRMRSELFWNITQRRVVTLYRRFGTTYRSHLQRSRSPFIWDFLTLEDGVRYVVPKRR